MTIRAQQMAPRWDNYVLLQGESFASFWGNRLSTEERNVLFVLGKGFDPRACLIAEVIMSLGGRGRRDCVALDFAEGSYSPSVEHQAEAEANWVRLRSLFKDPSRIDLFTIRMLDDRQRRIGSRTAGSVFGSLDALAPYSDVVVDISAIPRDIYFPLIGNILTLVDDANEADRLLHRKNIYVCVAENPVLDSLIVEQGFDEVASLIHGFGGGMERESTANLPRVWIPLLGENQETQLQRIRESFTPTETCPALPSPARDPRRADRLALTYHNLLFDVLQIDPRNFVFVSESNPFEVYRQIRSIVLDYQRVLQPLGGCKPLLSALSSKLLSLGALLVAYELRPNVAVAHVGSDGFRMVSGGDKSPTIDQSELFCLWLEGECYET